VPAISEGPGTGIPAQIQSWHQIAATARSSPSVEQTTLKKASVGNMRCQISNMSFFLAESSSVDSYKKACQRAIEEQGSGRKWDLAFVQSEDRFS